MPLAMSRPFKHPNSGVFWLRKGVPEDLRKIIGKREEKRSLKTRDPAEAKRRHAEALAEIEARWANLRAGPKVLTEREAHQLAVAVHDRWLQQHVDNPSQQTHWNVDLADRVFAKQKPLKSFDFLYEDTTAMVVDGDRLQVLQMEKWCLEWADECLAAHGLVVDDGGRRITSSSVELEAHQIEVVRRILQDPVQRYLLADEVGLGKTIEAGILIRQCILDTGDRSLVLVIVPEALVPQWRSELESKFFLGRFLDKSLNVLALSERKRIQPLLGKTTMLVIDEAHHLTGHRPTIDPGLYGDIAAAVSKIERVLLLSATPALHNERGFLEMLHLLDPDTYKLTDQEGFRLRIENRQALAGIVAGLTPENALYLDHPLDRLAKMFPDDALLQEQSQALRAISDKLPAEDDPALIEAVGRVRSHLSEAYRLHRRILRHRRRSVAGFSPLVLSGLPRYLALGWISSAAHLSARPTTAHHIGVGIYARSVALRSQTC